MKGSGIVAHALHSYYGRENLPGGRSSRIAESPSRSRPVHAFSLLDSDIEHPVSDVIVERSIRGLGARGLRFLAVRTLRGAKRRRFAASQFDLHTARRIAYLDPGSVSILHIWNRLPRTVDAARRRHPGVVVLRDVSIAREHDFELGDHISIENEAVDLFVSPSAYASEQLIAWGIPPEKLVEVPFGVDTERFRPRSSAAASPDAECPVRFAFAGAVSGRKGIPSLLRVWKRLSLDHAELHLYGTVKPEVQPWLEGVPRVYTHGFLDLTEELPKNDVFAFPSTREGSSKAVYEALASGLAVITTPNAGSVVRDGEEGILVPPEDEAALEEAIVYLYENAEARQRMGAMARTRAEAFTWERYARRVWQIYEASKELCSRT